MRLLDKLFNEYIKGVWLLKKKKSCFKINVTNFQRAKAHKLPKKEKINNKMKFLKIVKNLMESLKLLCG